MAKVNFTKPRIDAFRCPEDKAQTFFWDAEVSGLGVRVTPRGKPAFIFQRQSGGKTRRFTIGDTDAWSIPEARAKARELQRQLDQGEDPAEAKRAKVAAANAERERKASEGVTVGQLWPTYLAQGRPKGKASYKPRYLADLALVADPGGRPKKRGKGLTKPGPIFSLLEVPLADISEDRLLDWYREQELRGQNQAKRALMMFRGFLRWAMAQPQYRNMARSVHESAKAPAITSQLPVQKRRTDCIEPSQIAGWWSEALNLPNLYIGTYLRALLMTGLRRESLASLKWSDVDLRWKKATVADKVHVIRTIPLGEELVKMLGLLPKVNEYVFAGKGKPGHIKDPRASLARVLKAAELEHVSIHGLRRSFALLAEDAGIPVGAAEQYMGHSPTTTHEGYKPRSLDQLRVYINRLEKHLWQLRGVPQST